MKIKIPPKFFENSHKFQNNWLGFLHCDIPTDRPTERQSGSLQKCQRACTVTGG